MANPACTPWSINNVLKSNYNNAVDAVQVTAANVGTSGLPIGSIACRSTLTNPTNGCQPLDVFGTGDASQAAINYITGPARNGGNWALSVLNEDVVVRLDAGRAAGRLVAAAPVRSRWRSAANTARKAPASPPTPTRWR